jgi:hypothetical protein
MIMPKSDIRHFEEPFATKQSTESPAPTMHHAASARRVAGLLPPGGLTMTRQNKFMPESRVGVEIDHGRCRKARKKFNHEGHEGHEEEKMRESLQIFFINAIALARCAICNYVFAFFFVPFVSFVV